VTTLKKVIANIMMQVAVSLNLFPTVEENIHYRFTAKFESNLFPILEQKKNITKPYTKLCKRNFIKSYKSINDSHCNCLLKATISKIVN
jgi:DNA topoisomerase IA